METKVKSVSFTSSHSLPIPSSRGGEGSGSGDDRLNTVTTAATGVISRRASLENDLEDTNALMPTTLKEVGVILLREHEMLGSVKRLALELLTMPRYENQAVVKQIKIMIQDLMDRWPGEKIPIKLDSREHIEAFHTKVDELRHSLSADSFDEKKIPTDLLRRYEVEVLQRESEIVVFGDHVEGEVLVLSSTTMEESEKRCHIDQRIGELLVMKRFLTMYIGRGNHHIDDVDIDTIGKVYGCHIKPLQFLNKVKHESYPRTITVEHHDYDPVMAKIFRTFAVGLNVISLTGLREKISAMITDEYLIPKIILGEKYIVTQLDHYKNVAVELLAMPQLKRNALVVRNFNHYAESVTGGNHHQEIRTELDEWKKEFDRTEKESPDLDYKEFVHFASKRIAMALKNLTYLEGKQLPEIVANKYRNSMVDRVVEIVHLQNQEIEGRRKSQTFDLNAATKKGSHMIKFTHALSNGTFFAI